MPSGKYKNISPQQSPAGTVQGQEQQLIPPVQGQQPRRQGMTQPPPVLLSHHWPWDQQGCLKSWKQCRQLWWCFPMPGSSSPGSVHTAEELLYKIRAASHSAEAAELHHRNFHCRACRVVTMPTLHPEPKARNNPKRPLIPELCTAGARAG